MNCSSTDERGSGARYFDGGICPRCGLDSIYRRDADRYYHIDGTGNRKCWLAISRGDTLLFEREAAQAFDDAVHRLLAQQGLRYSQRLDAA